MVEVRRRERETIGAMLRRFTRKVQQSGVLISARKNRFYVSDASKREMKERAKLEKLGKLGKDEKR